MTPDGLCDLIKTKGLEHLDPVEVEMLASLNQSEYEQVVQNLLAGPDGNYRRYGCVLFTMRPVPDLYQEALEGALGIGDPSSNRDGAVALLQVKSADEIAIDLLELLDRCPGSDELVDQVFSLFYWVGFTPNTLVDPPAGSGYFNYAILTPLWVDREQKSANPEKAQQVSIQVLARMLDEFERKDSGRGARTIIALLTLLNPTSYPSELCDRIIRAYVRANSSTDPYIRNRVSAPRTQELIRTVQEEQ